MERRTYTAFENNQIITQGTIDLVAEYIKKQIGKNDHSQAQIFDDLTGRVFDIDFSGSLEDVMQRLKIYTPQDSLETTGRPGRPKLGVVCREISLLPHQWEWLSSRPGGASGYLRKLVDAAIKDDNEKNQSSIKIKLNSVATFLQQIAGDLPNFEDANRYLFRKDFDTFYSLIKEWPKDIKVHIKKMLQ